MTLRVIDVQQSILRKNTTLAQELRERFERRGTFVLNALSSPGSGKTTFLEETLHRMRAGYRVAALVGDQATEHDAVRLRRSGADVEQICTGAECRLDAQMVTRALSDLRDRDQRFDEAQLLVIENVGNLICPAEYDLGEDLRVVLFSVTEGEDKPLKYPLAFTTSHIAVISKIDLARATAFDRAQARANILTANPDITIIEVSAKTGEGMDRWIDMLQERMAGKFAPV